MLIFAIIVSIVLSIFSTAVLSYISMATPIGPWIAPTLALMAMPLFKWVRDQSAYTESVALVSAAGSVGGILATGMGFSLPTLYFLDPNLFNSWMASPFYFITVLACLAFAAGAFGLWIANMLEQKLVHQEKLAFPVGEMVYKMIAVQNQAKKAWDLFIGFVGTTVFCFLQDGLLTFKGFIPKALTLLPKFNIGVVSIPIIRLDLMPMLYAIGFVTGHVIAVPLAVGALSKIALIDPVNHLFFKDVSNFDFILAFGGGMVVSGTIFSFIGLPQMLYKAIKKLWAHGKNSFKPTDTGLNRVHLFELGLMTLFIVGFLTYFEFSLLAQIYLLLFTAMCTYEIVMQAGKIGIARLGAFATFVMVPAMFLFNLNFIQIVFIATFVEICGGVAADVLFGRKLALNAKIPSIKVERYQWLGLFVSAITVGVVFWLLINQFHLGSTELFALKAQNRQLLIDAKSFNLMVLIIGFIFGFLIKYARVNPSLVLGGILMPINISFGLIIGGLMTLFTKNREDWYPFWSGVFAANSVWMLVKALL